MRLECLSLSRVEIQCARLTSFKHSFDKRSQFFCDRSRTGKLKLRSLTVDPHNINARLGNPQANIIGVENNPVFSVRYMVFKPKLNYYRRRTAASKSRLLNNQKPGQALTSALPTRSQKELLTPNELKY
jgi:hypothetical protein